MNFIFYTCRINLSLIKLVSPQYSMCEQNSGVSSLGLINMATHFHVEKALLHLLPVLFSTFGTVSVKFLPGTCKSPFLCGPDSAAFGAHSGVHSGGWWHCWPNADSPASCDLFNQLTRAVSLPKPVSRKESAGFNYIVPGLNNCCCFLIREPGLKQGFCFAKAKLWAPQCSSSKSSSALQGWQEQHLHPE